MTFALLAGHPAIDLIPLSACTNQVGAALVIDQRGVLRPQDGDGNGSALCDSGAFETRSATGATVTPASNSNIDADTNTDPNQHVNANGDRDTHLDADRDQHTDGPDWTGVGAGAE